jgi:hypothetical protein
MQNQSLIDANLFSTGNQPEGAYMNSAKFNQNTSNNMDNSLSQSSHYQIMP